MIAGIEIHVELDTELDGTARLRSLFLTILERSYELCAWERGVRVCVCERERERDWGIEIHVGLVMELDGLGWNGSLKESVLMILTRSLVIGIGRGERGVATTEKVFNWPCLRANLFVT